MRTVKKDKIEVVLGDVLSSSENILVHQVNCLGVMGAGLALKLKTKYPEIFTEYSQRCKEQPDPLGEVLFTKTHDGRIIASLFGQRNVAGRNVCSTDYQALIAGFHSIKEYSAKFGFSIAIPYGIGCGLGGGDWSKVEEIIYEYLWDIPTTIYQLPEIFQ